MIIVQKMFLFVTVPLQDEFDTNRNTCISSRCINFLMKTKGLYDKYFRLIEYRSELLKKQLKTS